MVSWRRRCIATAASPSTTGATIRDLMLRLGHASEAAARRYLHTIEGRDAEIAAPLSGLAQGAPHQHACQARARPT